MIIIMEYLKKLVDAARQAVASKAYNITFHLYHKRRSLKGAIASCKGKYNAIIAEVKFSSPIMGKIRDPIRIDRVVNDMADGGAVALSILTQPNYFNGSLDNLLNARIATDLPLLMKDIVVSKEQIDAAYHAGADAILLICSLFHKKLIEYSLDDMIDTAHAYGLEVLLEVHNEHELAYALVSRADMIGINNRNLDTMQIDLATTVRLAPLAKGKYVISESGISSKEHIMQLKGLVDGFLVGTSIMSSNNIKSKVRELVMV